MTDENHGILPLKIDGSEKFDKGFVLFFGNVEEMLNKSSKNYDSVVLLESADKADKVEYVVENNIGNTHRYYLVTTDNTEGQRVYAEEAFWDLVEHLKNVE